MTQTTKNRNYVAAWVDYKADKIVVRERDENGKLYQVKYNPPYYFYVEDPEEGTFTSIFGHQLTRAEFSSQWEYREAKQQFAASGYRLFESDIQPLKRVLMDFYYNRPAPKVHFAFFDIEVDYAQKLGFAGPTNPYAPVNAITVYQSWTQEYHTIAVPPPGWTGTIDDIYAEIDKLIGDKLLRTGITPKVTLVSDEIELMQLFLKLIDDADIISGWNSEFFDIPYIAERLLLLGGESLLAQLELPGVRAPRKEMVNRFGSEEPIYKFSGRSHLDYMRLFQKFTFEGRTSYALGNILQEEVGVGKIEYDGTLEQLYKQNFPKFIAYNFRDTDGLVQIDDKFKFIALANQMAHENTVAFDAVLGTVAYVETGITNHAHYVLNKIVHDKVMGEHDRVEGAIVMTPRIGLHEWIGSVDINSLYPNTIRSLNISPEMIRGQFPLKEEAWRAIRDNDDSKRLVFKFETGEEDIRTAAEWKDFFLEKQWAISAYGTVFDQSQGRGVVADILRFWYNERKRLQAEKKKWGKKAKELETTLKGKPDDDVLNAELKEARRQEEHYDLLQLTKKISMNSLYGALLNVAFRFGDERMGASTTASGRAITTHMIETIGFLLTGERHPLIKTTTRDEDGLITHEYHTESPAIIYGDTDSCYYKTFATNKKDAVEAADLAAQGANDTFPAFMRSAFNCQPEFDDLIKAGREIVGVRGLFQAKKKYMIKVVDLEGVEVDKMKSMGSEIKKADTPKIIQSFLKTTVDMILDGKSYDDVAKYVNEQRKVILKKRDNMFLLGVAKQVNNLDKYAAEYVNPGSVYVAGGRKLTIPGHARAALNFNTLLDVFDKGSKPIRTGDKVLIFYLKPNAYKFDSIAFPAEFTKFPQWFVDNFKVDINKTEQKMFDSKLRGVFDAIGEVVPTLQSVFIKSIVEF